MPIESNQCCLCDDAREGTLIHLLAEYRWITVFEGETENWSSISIQRKGVN